VGDCQTNGDSIINYLIDQFILNVTNEQCLKYRDITLLERFCSKLLLISSVIIDGGKSHIYSRLL